MGVHNLFEATGHKQILEHKCAYVCVRNVDVLWLND